MNLKNAMLSKSSQIKKEYVSDVWFHLYDFQEQAKLIYGGRNLNTGCL